MANIIVERGWYQMGVRIEHADGTVENVKGGWHKDEVNGQAWAAYRQPEEGFKGPVTECSLGWSAPEAVQNLLKLEDEKKVETKP